jgi:hypothetical protein
MNEMYPFPWQFDRFRYSSLYLMQQVTEAMVQKDILDLLHVFNVDAVAIDAGGRRQRGRMMGAAKKAGVDLSTIQNSKNWYSIPAGFSDVEATLAPSGRAFYIEVKAPAWVDGRQRIIRPAGRPTQEQLDFLFSKHLRGACVMIAWSSKDVQEFLGAQLEMNRGALA